MPSYETDLIILDQFTKSYLEVIINMDLEEYFFMINKLDR